MDSQEQHKKQNYDWLNGYKFVKGQSGNPGGRPKGAKSLKTFAREYLESLPDEEKVNYLKTLPEDLVWKMAEGNPKTDTDITSDGKAINNIVYLPAKPNTDVETN
jgi:hypothetical protein